MKTLWNIDMLPIFIQSLDGFQIENCFPFKITDISALSVLGVCQWRGKGDRNSKGHFVEG